MKKNLQKSWPGDRIALLNILTILGYLLGFWLNKKFYFSPILNVVGVVYLLFITPLNLLSLCKLRFKNRSEWLLASLTLFFAILVPAYFILNYFFHLPFLWEIIFFLNLTISVLTVFFFYHNPLRACKEIWGGTNYQLFLSKLRANWPLLITLGLFFILHIINYHFYIFIPEWDSYSKLVEINNVLQTNTLTISYRGFFTVATVIISKFTELNPYIVFTAIFTLLQATLVITLFLLTKIYKISNRFYQFIILSSSLAVPVLNLEIDVIRPQTVFIILLPVYIYFLLRAIATKKKDYWLITLIITFGGLNYHEFFVFIFLLQAGAIFTMLFQKYYLQAQESKDRLIFKLSAIIIILFGIIIANHFSFINYVFIILKKISQQITQFDKWNWWFLDNYAADTSGQQLGWPGMFGAIKYYAYYASPFVLFTLLTIFYLKIKKQIKNQKIIFYIVTPLIFTLLVYNELLPRLNYIYLPERIWLIIDILTILLFPFLFFNIKLFLKKSSLFHYFLYFIVFSVLLGIGGTIYIAKNKKALTSKNEYRASLWIKHHTPKESFFITQEANKPMVTYFAERQFIPLKKSFFDNPSDLKNIFIPTPEGKVEDELKNINTFIINHPPQDDNALEGLLQKIRMTKKKINQLKRPARSTLKVNSENSTAIYILYSMDKFQGLYTQREWWLQANHYQAPIDNFTKTYPLVYNKDGIYIWKIK